MTSFVRQGFEVPFVFFSDADGAAYHTTADELERLNINKVNKVSNAVANLSLLALRKKNYKWHGPRQVFSIYLPRKSDVLPMLSVVNSVLKNSTQNHFNNKEIQELRSFQALLKKMNMSSDSIFYSRYTRSFSVGSMRMLALARSRNFIP